MTDQEVLQARAQAWREAYQLSSQMIRENGRVTARLVALHLLERAKQMEEACAETSRDESGT